MKKKAEEAKNQETLDDDKETEEEKVKRAEMEKELKIKNANHQIKLEHLVRESDAWKT